MGIDATVIVVGGGIAGASAASFLAEAGARVTLLEAEATCGQHTTGRSAALFTEAYAAPAMRRLAVASRRFLEHPPDGFADQPIATPLGLLFVASHTHLETLERERTQAQEHVPTVRAVSADEAVGLVPVLDRRVVAGGYLEPDARDLDVHCLHQGFLRWARSRGAVIRTSHRVTGLERRSTGWRVSAGGARYDADVVVDAAGAWSDRVATLAGIPPLGIAPLRRTAFIVGLPQRPSGWPMVVDVDEQWYCKPEGIGLLCSPADEWPSEPCDARPREEDVAVGIERINAVTTLGIRSIRSSWAGLRSFLPDRLPAVGFDPDTIGFFWLAGQGGSGIKTAPALGMLTADLVAGAGPRDPLVEAGVDPAALTPGRLRAGR